MSTYWVDFSGYCEVKADSADEAIGKFWDYLQYDVPLPHNVYTLEGVEEKSD